MKFSILRVFITVLSVFIGGAIWIGLLLLLKNSDIPSLQRLVFYISHFTIMGWLLFGLLSVAVYLLISKYTL